MVRRCAERTNHNMINEFMKHNHMCDLQGLLLDDAENFTVAIEAFSITKKEQDALKREHEFTQRSSMRKQMFSDEQWSTILSFAEAMKIPFNLFLHTDGEDKIRSYSIDKEDLKNAILGKAAVYSNVLNEHEFLSWWAQHKKTKQEKGYRSEMRSRLENSYFDRLLERNGHKWGGNIDAILPDINNEYCPLAIIENRTTTKKHRLIRQYDPQVFYQQDENTWNPLYLVCTYLKLPLFLATFSTNIGEEKLIGLTEVDVYKSKSELDECRKNNDNLEMRSFPHLYYIDNLEPCNNVFSSIDEASEWMWQRIVDFHNRN